MIKEAMAVPALVSPPPYRVELAERDETCSLEWWNRVFVFQGNQGSWRQVAKLQRKAFNKKFMSHPMNAFLSSADLRKLYVSEDEALLMERVFAAANRVLARCGFPFLPFSGSSVHILDQEAMEKLSGKYINEEDTVKSMYMYGRIYINRHHLQSRDAAYVLAQTLIEGLSHIGAYKEIVIFRDGRCVGRNGIQDVVEDDVNNEIFDCGVRTLFAHAVYDELAKVDGRFAPGAYGFYQSMQATAFVVFLIHQQAGRHKGMASEIFRRLLRAYIGGQGEAWQILGVRPVLNDDVTRNLSLQEDYWEECLFLCWPEFRNFLAYWQNFLPAL